MDKLYFLLTGYQLLFLKSLMNLAFIKMHRKSEGIRNLDLEEHRHNGHTVETARKANGLS